MDVFDFLRWFAERIAHMPDNDETLERIDYSYAPPEVGAVLCRRERGFSTTYYIGEDHSIRLVEAVGWCVKTGGRVYAEVHTHPGQPAIFSRWDLSSLLARERWEIPKYYCVARLGRGRAVIFCVKIPSKNLKPYVKRLSFKIDYDKAEKVKYYEAFDHDVDDYVEIPVMSNEDSEKFEEEYFDHLRRNGVDCFKAEIPV